MSTREAYIEKLKAQLDSCDAAIRKYEAKMREAKADARIQYEQQLQQLRQRREDARSRMDELKKASGSAWEDLKDGADRAWAACKDAVDRAASQFRS